MVFKAGVPFPHGEVAYSQLTKEEQAAYMRKKGKEYYLKKVNGVLKRDPLKLKPVKAKKQKAMVDEFGRVCTHCKEYKTWDNFSSKNSIRDAHKTATHVFKQPLCKPCANVHVSTWRESKTPEQLKELYLQRTYGISLYEFEHRLKEQHNCCPLCGRILDVRYTNKSLNPASACVDHCHKTDKVRGILCNECNRGLGYFHDSISALRRASQYLAHSRLEE